MYDTMMANKYDIFVSLSLSRSFPLKKDLCIFVVYACGFHSIQIHCTILSYQVCTCVIIHIVIHMKHSIDLCVFKMDFSLMQILNLASIFKMIHTHGVKS